MANSYSRRGRLVVLEYPSGERRIMRVCTPPNDPGDTLVEPSGELLARIKKALEEDRPYRTTGARVSELRKNRKGS